MSEVSSEKTCECNIFNHDNKSSKFEENLHGSSTIMILGCKVNLGICWTPNVVHRTLVI